MDQDLKEIYLTDRIYYDYLQLAASPVRGIYLLPPTTITGTKIQNFVGTMFIFEGPYTGAIIKFGIFVTHHYPLLSKPALKIISPSNISHPYINRMDNKVVFEWDPENDNFITLLQQFQNMFVQYVPVSEAEKNQIASSVELSIKEISVPSNPSKKDTFTPCQLQWTDKLLELKSAYLNMGNIEQIQSSEVI